MGFEFTFTGDIYILFILSTFIFIYGGWPFLKGAVDELKQKNPGMMTLIAMAIIVAYIYSSLTVFLLEGDSFFWELATLIVIMLLGHYVEMKSVIRASNALEKLVKLMPSEANIIDDEGNVRPIKVDQLKLGDKLLIKPGEKVPVDGLVIKGTSSLDESMLTGESLPVIKKKDDQVIGGAINGESILTISVEKTGKESYLYQVIEMVREAQETKSRTQDLANHAAKLLFYLALIAGVLTFVIWLLITDDLRYALERMVTVMIIACPHALGLAAPLVVAKSTSIAAQNGLLIRNRASFEQARNLDSIVFDKTGTLTKGEFIVTDIVLMNGYSENDIFQYAGSLESQSSHPLSIGLINSAKAQNVKLETPVEFENITGKGIQGIVNEKDVKVMSPGYMRENKINFPQEEYQKLSKQGKTISFVLVDDELIGFFALADEIRETSKEAITMLKNMHISPMMLTGDNKLVASWVNEELKLDEVYAEVLPHQKVEVIQSIKDEGRKVAMTGDGINDAPALTTADLGIAIGAGTDVAIESADVILVRSDPKDVVSIISLSKSTYRKMKQNLWWAAGYNILAIPLAAGILSPIGIVVSPAIGAILMSLSTIIVAMNAQLFKGEEED